MLVMAVMRGRERREGGKEGGREGGKASQISGQGRA